MTKAFFKFMTTLGPLGYLPAPGTIGSLFSIIAVYYLNNNIYAIILLSILALLIIDKAYYYYSHEDPSEIILDEFIGCLIAFYGLPLNINIIILCFLIFRFLDITKILGISRSEKFFNGAWAILIDDIIAGIITNVIMRAILNYY